MEEILKKWYPLLKGEITKPYFGELVSRVAGVPASDLCPPAHQVFRVYRDLGPDDVKVVILGLDPYIRGEACGYSFSSEKGNVPPSLRIIFNTIRKETGQQRTDSNLADWVQQGVFLLNTVLTTERGKTLAHGKWGWQNFTGETLRHLASSSSPVVFMIWGNMAKESLVQYITPALKGPKLVLENCHPMAEIYGRYKFSESGHFTKANEFLVAHGKTPILWASSSAPTTTST